MNTLTGLAGFFRRAADFTASQALQDPANKRNRIDEYPDEKDLRQDLVAKLEQAAQIASKAVQLEERGAHKAAVEQLQRLFPSVFTVAVKKSPEIIDRTPPRPYLPE